MQISFVNYFKQQYGIEIREHNQPMLKSNPKERDRRRGLNNAALLVPELCVLTGLTEKMRENQRMMRELTKYNQQRPEQQ